MGKPLKARLSKSASLLRPTQSSKTSLLSNMSTQKNENAIRRKQKKQRVSIQKLFDRLRNERNESSGSDKSASLDDSVIIVNPSTSNDSTNRKRKHPSLVNFQENCNGPIEIKDDDDLVLLNSPTASPTKRNSHVMLCSTPLLNKKSKLHNNLNISNVSALSNKINTNLDTISSKNGDLQDITKEINEDSYLTIDLTHETVKSKNSNIVDVENGVDTSDCVFVSISKTNSSLSLSGESEVTVINTAKRKKGTGDKKLQNICNGIAKMNAAQKGKLLELITKNIFNGCRLPDAESNHSQVKASTTNHSTETVEDTYIKEVILGQKASRNSIGSNIYNPGKDPNNKTGLRLIVIDGSNVAFEHTKGRTFSVIGLKICIDYFLRRGHVVKAFVPRFRCKFGKSSHPRMLDDLERQGHVVYTPSREVQGRNICSYDDRYIVQCAAEFDGVIVSGDNYRDLMLENPRWRFIIENRLLLYTWVNDMIMFPRDPLGRNGPTLENFLKHSN